MKKAEKRVNVLSDEHLCIVDKLHALVKTLCGGFLTSIRCVVVVIRSPRLILTKSTGTSIDDHNIQLHGCFKACRIVDPSLIFIYLRQWNGKIFSGFSSTPVKSSPLRALHFIVCWSEIGGFLSRRASLIVLALFLRTFSPPPPPSLRKIRLWGKRFFNRRRDKVRYSGLIMESSGSGISLSL